MQVALEFDGVMGPFVPLSLEDAKEIGEECLSNGVVQFWSCTGQLAVCAIEDRRRSNHTAAVLK